MHSVYPTTASDIRAHGAVADLANGKGWFSNEGFHDPMEPTPDLPLLCERCNTYLTQQVTCSSTHTYTVYAHCANIRCVSVHTNTSFIAKLKCEASKPGAQVVAHICMCM